jgi:uncharacterized protein (DUF488 family)
MPPYITDNGKLTIWTIGHSNHSAETFKAMLKSFDIELVADIRRFPGSKKYPHFNKETLENLLAEINTKYVHFPELGGRRKPRPDSKNIAWRHEAFRGYADYMETDEFKKGINQLMTFAKKYRTVYMCSEAVWWSCHRSLVSDYLKSLGWQVMHIMGVNKSNEHPYTSVANIIDGQLVYALPDFFG